MDSRRRMHSNRNDFAAPKAPRNRSSHPTGKQSRSSSNGRLLATDVNRGDAHAHDRADTGRAGGGSWGANDIIVFAEWVTGLYAVPARGGPVSRLTRLDHTALDVAHAWPQFLPDGRRFLYQVISPDKTRAGVYVGKCRRARQHATARLRQCGNVCRSWVSGVSAARHAAGRSRSMPRICASAGVRCGWRSRRDRRHRLPKGTAPRPRATCWRFAQVRRSSS